MNYGPPPQRGQAPSRSVSRFSRNSPAAIAVGIAFFLAWTGFVGYRFFSRDYGKPTRISKVPAPARSPLRQAAHSPLTDVDMQNLQTLPEQAQAEELLDRAIRHDPRALDAFEQNIGVWHGLQRTAHINELERRSQFSTDLRVRTPMRISTWQSTELRKLKPRQTRSSPRRKPTPRIAPTTCFPWECSPVAAWATIAFILSWWITPRMTQPTSAPVGC